MADDPPIYTPPFDQFFSNAFRYRCPGTNTYSLPNEFPTAQVCRRKTSAIPGPVGTFKPSLLCNVPQYAAFEVNLGVCGSSKTHTFSTNVFSYSRILRYCGAVTPEYEINPEVNAVCRMIPSVSRINFNQSLAHCFVKGTESLRYFDAQQTCKKIFSADPINFRSYITATRYCYTVQSVFDASVICKSIKLVPVSFRNIKAINRDEGCRSYPILDYSTYISARICHKSYNAVNLPTFFGSNAPRSNTFMCRTYQEYLVELRGVRASCNVQKGIAQPNIIKASVFSSSIKCNTFQTSLGAPTQRFHCRNNMHVFEGPLLVFGRIWGGRGPGIPTRESGRMVGKIRFG